MNALEAALREKFGTPDKALAALGLSPSILASDGPMTTALKRNPKMAKLSTTALRVHAALTALIGPMLAADAKLDLTPAVAGITRKNLGAKKAEVWKRAKALTKGKLAQDGATPDDVALKLLAMIDGQSASVEPEGGAMGGAGGADPAALAGAADPAGAGGAPDPAAGLDPNAAPPAAGLGGEAAPGEEDDEEEGADPAMLAKLAEALGGDENLAKTCYDIMHGSAKDEEASPEAAEPEHEGAPVEDEEGPPMMPKPAMDTAMKQLRESMRAENRAANEARAFVRPWVGEVSAAYDTAGDIYKATLQALGVDLKGVHPSAYRTILQHMPRAGKVHAMDSAPGAKKPKMDAASRFPGAARIKVMG